METESVRILRSRAGDLSDQLSECRKKAALLEFELLQVEGALALMTDIPAKGLEASRNAMAHGARQANPEMQGLSMKQLVVKALTEHFTNGATANELLDFFAVRWGRTDVIRTSLSPQLTRLKREGRIELHGKVWMIAADQKQIDLEIEELLGGTARNENGEAETSPEVSPSDVRTVAEGSDQPIAPSASTS